MINRVINKISHSIYKDIEEFKRYNPNTDAKYNWRDGTEGNWVVSDDGQVCQVLKRGGKLKASRSDKVIKNYIQGTSGTFVCVQIKLKWKEILGKTFIRLAWLILMLINIRLKKKKKRNHTKRVFVCSVCCKGTDLVDAFLKAYPTENRSTLKVKLRFY